MTRFAPLLIATLALLSGCSPHKSHSAWGACEKHLRKEHGLDTKKRPDPNHPPKPLDVSVVSRRGSKDVVTFTCDVTVTHDVNKVDPMNWYFWLFGGAEFSEEYRHTVTLRRTNGKWRVTESEIRRKP